MFCGRPQHPARRTEQAPHWGSVGTTRSGDGAGPAAAERFCRSAAALLRTATAPVMRP